MTDDDQRIEGWPWFDPIVLSIDDQNRYLKRKKAVELRLLERKRAVDVFKDTGIRATELKRQIERCLQTHPDGSAYGYRGLVPDQKTSYNRQKEETLGLAEGRG